MQPRPARFLEGPPSGVTGHWAAWIEELARRPGEPRGARAPRGPAGASRALRRAVAAAAPVAGRGARRARHRAALHAPGAGHRGAARRARHGGGDRHGERQEPVLPRAGAGAAAHRARRDRALPVPDQGARAGPAQERGAARLGPPGRAARPSPPASTTATRRRRRAAGCATRRNLILSNPDMLHQGILPYHAKWARFLRSLRYVVVDEIHTYRGIFGSHVANVLRRLERVARHVGGEFRVVMCSATIRNPQRAGRGADRPRHDGGGRRRRAAGREALRLLEPALHRPDARRAALLERRGRGAARRACSSAARRRSSSPSRASRRSWSTATPASGSSAIQPGLGEAIQPYRGGYLPRGAARDRAGAVLGRAARRGQHERARAGRRHRRARRGGHDRRAADAGEPLAAGGARRAAGRRGGRAPRRPALAVLVAYNDTVDQYLMRHPEYFFGRSPEAAVVDPRNPYILAQQLACAAYELPLDARGRGGVRAADRRRSSRRSRRRGRRAPSTATPTGRRPTSRPRPSACAPSRTTPTRSWTRPAGTR